MYNNISTFYIKIELLILIIFTDEGNSTGSMINDDRFIFHTLNNWDFGVDDTGNLTECANLNHLINKFSQKIDLVTADGSIGE